MLNENAGIVFDYLKNHFKENRKPVTIFDININTLSMADIEKALEELSKSKLIKLDDNYIYPCIECVNLLRDN